MPTIYSGFAILHEYFKYIYFLAILNLRIYKNTFFILQNYTVPFVCSNYRCFPKPNISLLAQSSCNQEACNFFWGKSLACLVPSNRRIQIKATSDLYWHKTRYVAISVLFLWQFYSPPSSSFPLKVGFYSRINIPFYIGLKYTRVPFSISYNSQFGLDTGNWMNRLMEICFWQREKKKKKITFISASSCGMSSKLKIVRKC